MKSTVMELQSNIMTSTSYFLSTIFATDERLSTEKSPQHSARRRESLFREFHSTAVFLEPPRWPVECKVLPQSIPHIFVAPSKAEPFYVPTGSESQPQPVGEEMGTVIFYYQPKLSVDYYCHSTTHTETESLQTFQLDENTLRFESRFECGNLGKVIKITNVYYEIYLRPDMYTDRHSQWYYFRVQNMKEGVLYRFSIVNLNKPESLYRFGLKPLIYSEKNAQLNGVGWVRGGKNIAYFKNDLTTDENGSFYTLTFNLKFKYVNDTVYIAQCYPYSYTNLQNYLKANEMDRFKVTVCQQRLLCKTLGGNNIYMLTISSPETFEEDEQDSTDQKPVVFLTARVHPGETPSSFMMKGIIDFLTSDSPHAQTLRDRFIFKIIPMLNPDGVIVGNSRCCLLGQDLNRQYGTVLREAFPQIYHAKVILRRLAEEGRLFLYCDIHGHSRKNNAFIYGCENRRISDRKLTEQIFPLMMHKNASDKFSFQSCKFKVQKSKEGTGRLFVWTLGVINSYTLEVSLGGSTLASRNQSHFHIGDYEALGRHFCETLLDYSDPDKEQLRERMLQKLIDKGSTAEEPVNVMITDYSSLSHSESENELSETEDEPGEKKSPPSKQRQTSFLTRPKYKSAKHKMKTVLNMSKASVELLSFGKKHKNMEQDGEIEETVQLIKKKVEVASQDSPTKCRRIRRESIIASIERRRLLSTGAAPFQRYSKVVFDDPFKTPNPDASLVLQPSPKVRSKLRKMEAEMVQSEDECDQTDSGFRSEGLVDELSCQMSTLTVSSKSQECISSEVKPTVGLTRRRQSSAGITSKTQIHLKVKAKQEPPPQKPVVKIRINSGKKQSILKSQKSEVRATESSSNLSVPKLTSRRGSWNGEPSCSTSPSAAATALNTRRRASVQKSCTKTKTIRKSVSLVDTSKFNDEKVDKTSNISRSPLTSRRERTSISTTSKRKKLQRTKKIKTKKPLVKTKSENS